MELTKEDESAAKRIAQSAVETGLIIKGGKVRRTSSRFCLSVEHGDYNGTELLGVGTNRFIWMAYKPNGTKKVRIASTNFPDDGIIEYDIGNVPKPNSPEIVHTWGRFPFGVDFILKRKGYDLKQGIDAVVYGNIPGGGMSRSASLSLNLILSMLDVNGIEVGDSHKKKLEIVDLAQAVENDYIGSPCGKLDQTMILFAREGMGTHYNPKDRTISYIPFGGNVSDFNLVVMDTGTDRPGLEKATYSIRRKECERLVEILKKIGYKWIDCLADIKDDELYKRIMAQQIPAQLLQQKVKTGTGRIVPISEEGLKERLRYIFEAQKRFYEMVERWEVGDIVGVGNIFRADGIGLRDYYKISGPELETMCDIARTVPGVLGERMLGGGDKGAAGAIVLPDAVDKLKAAVEMTYPKSHPDFLGKYAVHVLNSVEGVKVFKNIIP